MVTLAGGSTQFGDVLETQNKLMRTLPRSAL